MDNPSLQQQIVDTQARIEDLHRQMQETDEEFRKAVAQRMGDWYEQEAERVVVNKNPERALEVGQNEVEALRGGVKSLADGLRQHAHIGDFSFSRTYNVEHDVSSALKRLASNLGRLLASHGFIPLPQPLSGDADWSYNQYESGNPPPTYDGDLPWSDRMKKAKDTYSALDGQLVSASNNLRELRHRKAQEDAKKLWDQAQG